MIDTLLLSGGGLKGIAYFALYDFLNELNYMDNIKNIVSCSIGSFFGVCMSMRINNKIIIKILINVLLLNKSYSIDHIDFDSFDRLGFFENTLFPIILKHLFKYKYNREKLTLIELYNETGINNEVKIYNYTKMKTEYYNHLNNPDMDVGILIAAATSMPIVNKYVIYKDQYLLDGGISGKMPKCNYKNYFGVVLNDSLIFDIDKDDIISYLEFLFFNRTDTIECEYFDDNRMVNINLELSVFKFNMTIDELESCINKSYDMIKEFYNNNKDIFDLDKSSEEPTS